MVTILFIGYSISVTPAVIVYCVNRYSSNFLKTQITHLTDYSVSFRIINVNHVSTSFKCC